MDRRYNAQTVDITNSIKRFIHSKECVCNLSAVFTKDRRPWIDADEAEATDVVRVVP